MSAASTTREFDPGLPIQFNRKEFRFTYGSETFGPEMPELRRLNDIRAGLRDPQCEGPDPVYAIAMDVGVKPHARELQRRRLLYGVVAYAAGRLGTEPVRSQGHVHAVAPLCGWSTPELVEVWSGRAIVYLQKAVADDPVLCVAVKAGPGDVVVIPPGWGHCILNVDAQREMVFGAFCVRQYAFVYQDVRKRGGLAWFAELKDSGHIEWHGNPAYTTRTLDIRQARQYPELGLQPNTPIYQQFVSSPERLQWVSEPAIYARLWESFEP